MMCDLTSCAGTRKFLVDHPDKGELAVCQRHAQNIAEIGGEVVSLV